MKGETQEDLIWVEHNGKCDNNDLNDAKAELYNKILYKWLKFPNTVKMLVLFDINKAKIVVGQLKKSTIYY